MKYLFTLIVVFLFFSRITYSQDTIVLKDGTKIFCKILREDSVSVFLSINKNGNNVSMYSQKSDIELIQYGKQPETPVSDFDKLSMGFGIGMDFGGIGGNLVYYPHRNFGMFAGFGYALAGVGYNAGIKIRLITEKHKSKLFPYLIGMYGYNTIILVENAEEYNKFFYGPTIGFGVDFRSHEKSRGYWTIAVLVPIRSPDVNNYTDDLKNYHNVEFKNELIPIGLTVGYMFIIK